MSIRTCDEFIHAIINDYVNGIENAYEAYQSHGYKIDDKESDIDFIKRSAKLDYEAIDCLYADYLYSE